jgi:hypothetical protein
MAGCIEVKGTVTGVVDGSVRHGHLEKAVTVDGHVQRLVGGLQRTLGEVLLGADDAHTGTQLQAGGELIVLGGLGTRLAADLVQQVLEFGAVALEARGGHVGQVVGDGGEVHVLGGQTGLGDPQ